MLNCEIFASILLYFICFNKKKEQALLFSELLYFPVELNKIIKLLLLGKCQMNSKIMITWSLSEVITFECHDSVITLSDMFHTYWIYSVFLFGKLYEWTAGDMPRLGVSGFMKALSKTAILISAIPSHQMTFKLRRTELCQIPDAFGIWKARLEADWKSQQAKYFYWLPYCQNI